ncbi:type 1 glutamine amidotransferase [Arhodomonas aquaeolei]|uniref:type 1 glutamine amidotransferase n=1 Tax=Arhodomonas TaxID=2368 RepID=UPI002168915C|nr:type 1 glutamine amidotransferase [Arhodomonas aquaeolei]MCS4502564.1 type 1 glutamine amidotransferase [Arhodomonas aquaeolei]
MRAHYLQHVPFEGPERIAEWLEDAGYTVTGTPLYRTAALPAPDEVDLLVVMGGPMSVNDEVAFPWLAAEKAFVRGIIEAGTPVLGVCLGAQVIASAMGGAVGPGPEKEIGWFPIRGEGGGDRSLFRFPPSVEVFHWHGEALALPPGAVRLASSPVCPNQAFQLGRTVLGLQFHLETTPASARALVEHCGDELVPAPYVQSAADILAAPDTRYEAINALMGEVLAFLHQAAPAAAGTR